MTASASTRCAAPGCGCSAMRRTPCSRPRSFINSVKRRIARGDAGIEAQRQAIFADARWQGSSYDPAQPPDAGLAAARAIAMTSYRSRASFERRFGRAEGEAGLFQVESYLRHQGRQLVERFDANTYVTLTRAMDSHDVARERGEYEDVLRSIGQPALVVSIDSDVLYPLVEQIELASLLPAATFHGLHSDNGHDAFLVDAEKLEPVVMSFRARLSAERPGARDVTGALPPTPTHLPN